MQFVNVREFKLNATQYLYSNQEVIITRYGKPIARLVPETEESISTIIEAAGKILKDAGITKEEALNAIKLVRKESRS